MRRAVQDQHAAQRVEQVERVKHAQSRSADAHWWAVLGAQVALVLVVCAALIPANIAGIRDGLLWQDVQRLNQVSVAHYQTAPTACLTIYHPWPELIRSQLAYLQQAHLAIYSLPAATRDRLLRPQAIAGITPCTKPYRRFIDDASGQPTEPIVRRVARVDAGPSGWRLR